MKNILVLCTGNSCRSQLAEGYLRYFAKNKAVIYSAGAAPQGVHPITIQVMTEDQLDISLHTSNHVDEYAAINFDMVITVCDHAHEVCPFFAGKVVQFHQSFPDPAKAQGSEEAVINEFRKVRDQIKRFSASFIKQYIDQ